MKHRSIYSGSATNLPLQRGGSVTRKNTQAVSFIRNKKTKVEKKKNILKELTADELLFDPQELATSFEKTVAAFQSQLATIRTGIAHPAILDSKWIRVLFIYLFIYIHTYTYIYS